MITANHSQLYASAVDRYKPENMFIRIKPSVKRVLERLAAAEGLSLNLFVCRVLEREVIASYAAEDAEGESA